MDTVHIIAALTEKKRVIGNVGSIPWHIPNDFKRFKNLTSGHPMIMGRKTYESIGKALPDRTNLVVSNTMTFDDALSAHSLQDALAKAKKAEGGEDIFIIGGNKLYEEGLDYADILHLTLIHNEYEGDVHFPEYTPFSKIVFKEEHLDEDPPYTFIDLVK